MGTIYKRRKSNNWWIQYSRNGKLYRESTGSSRKMVAQKLLAQREGEIVQGKLPGVHFEKVSFNELADDFIKDYQINQKKSLPKAKRSRNHLQRFFGQFKIPQITTPKIREFIGMRLEEGVTNGTVNRELSALKRMLNLGAKQTPPKVDRVPHIPMLKEKNVRKGFFEHGEFLALREALPDYLKGFVTFAYSSGWRFTEITGLTWKQVDLNQGVVRLEAGETKNDEARTFVLDKELKGIFHYQLALRKQRAVITSYVFPNINGDGRIKDIRGSWFKACEEIGIGRRLFHDLRRTAVRNMVRAGIPERVAMMISGHKTRSVFDRYNITSNADLIEASQRQALYKEEMSRFHISFTPAVFPTKKGASRNG